MVMRISTVHGINAPPFVSGSLTRNFQQLVRRMASEKESSQPLGNRVMKNTGGQKKKPNSLIDGLEMELSPLEWAINMRTELNKKREYERIHGIKAQVRPEDENILEYLERTNKEERDKITFHISELPLSTEPHINFLKGRVERDVGEENEKKPKND